MKKLFLISQFIIGLLFLVYGANGLFTFIQGYSLLPIPEPSPEMKTVMAGLFAAKYLMPVVKIIELVCGGLLIVNRYSNFALVLLGPIVFNITCIHLFTNPSGIPLALIMSLLWIIAVIGRKNQFINFFLKN